jgi:signal transduction histidine kinase
VPREATAPQPVCEALIQITREAVRNATRHGHPKHIWLVLSLADRRLRLAIVDDGQGFRTHEVSIGSGFGLTSMRERAERIGASFRVDSGVRGTTVEVLVG